MIAPEPFLSAYLQVARQAVLHTRRMSLENKESFAKRLSGKRAAQIADLQDAIHVVLELLNDWERCDEPALRAYLENYDKKWMTNESSFSMLETFELILEKERGSV